MSHQGWTNYETWAISLWLRNEEGSYRHWSGVALERLDEAEPVAGEPKREAAVRELADELRMRFEDEMPDAVNGTVYADLLTSALEDVNWFEVAESLISDAEEEREYEARKGGRDAER